MTPAAQSLWLLVATALLMLTLPGAALFYGGMVRKKSVVSTIGLPICALALVSLWWFLAGERLVYGRDGAEVGDGIWPLYHAMTASLALALVVGGVVERVRLLFFLVFGVLWVTLVHGPLAFSLWGGGWLGRLGCLDYAGGAVVHAGAGVTALAAAIVIGPRKGYGRIEMMPNHLPLSVCGAGLMWVGWMGFATGHAPVSIATVASAMAATHVSAAAAALTWMTAEWLQRDKPTALGTVSGAVAGLVAIAPAAGYVSPLSAVVVGVGAGGLCYMVVNYVKLILGYDDSLDVFGMHGIGGTWGLIATGLFSSTDVNPDGSDGLFYGYPYQLFAQLVAVAATWVLAGGVSVLLLKGLALVLAPRVDEEAEMKGLDLAQHGEKGYS